MSNDYQEKTGFEKQRTGSDCGPSCLRHALLLLGDVKYRGVVENVVGWGSGGTNILDFFKGTRKLGYDTPEINSADPHIVINRIHEYLMNGCPLAISVDDNRHFVLVGSYHEKKDKFMVIDSYYKPFWALVSATELLERMIFDDEYYMGNAIIPKDKVQRRMSIVKDFAVLHYPNLREDKELAVQWGTILEDLSSLKSFYVPIHPNKAYMSSGQFFKAYQKKILDIIDGSQDIDGFERDGMEWLVDQYRYVAEAYGFVVNRNLLPIATAEITTLVLTQKMVEEFV